MDYRDWVLCCMHSLIRMNFTNNQLVARVDKTKTGVSFIIFLLPLHFSFFKFGFFFFVYAEDACLNRKKSNKTILNSI